MAAATTATVESTVLLAKIKLQTVTPPQKKITIDPKSESSEKKDKDKNSRKSIDGNADGAQKVPDEGPEGNRAGAGAPGSPLKQQRNYEEEEPISLIEDYLLVNLDCWLILLLDHLKGKLLQELTNSDLDLIDEGGQILNLNDAPPKNRASEVLTAGALYYPLIIQKKPDGSLHNFEIYGKEKFAPDVMNKLSLQVKRNVNKLTRRKAAENIEVQESAEAMGTGGAGTGSSTGKPRKKRSEKSPAESTVAS